MQCVRLRPEEVPGVEASTIMLTNITKGLDIIFLTEGGVLNAEFITHTL